MSPVSEQERARLEALASEEEDVATLEEIQRLTPLERLNRHHELMEFVARLRDAGDRLHGASSSPTPSPTT
jgi:hypothetical protein